MMEFELKAGAKTQVLSLFSDSVPQRIAFDVANVDGTDPSGRIEVETSMLPLMTPRLETLPLQAQNTLQKGWLQTNVAIHVTSDSDAVLAFQTRHLTSRKLWITLAVVAVIGIVAAIIPLLVKL